MIASGFSHGPNGSLRIILGITDPRQAKIISSDNNVANRLQQLLLGLGFKKYMVA